MRSVLQDWVMELPLREQGTLLTSVRSCDLAPKITGQESPERQLVAFLRYCVLNAADPREVGIEGAFFSPSPPKDWKPSQFGHYPQHWYAHLMHSFEVVGYRHPNEWVRATTLTIYERLVRNMHLTPESFTEMVLRLSEDRIANNTVVS